MGGGLCWSCGEGVSDGTLDLVNVLLSGNLAGEGGAAAFDGGGPVTGHGLDIEENLATTGGALFLRAQRLSLSASLVALNEADNGAGAMLTEGSALELVNVGLFYNLAYLSVGGVALYGSSLSCLGDPSDDALGVFANAEDSVPGYQIWLDGDSNAHGEACDLADVDLGVDGDIYNLGDSAVYSFGLDADFDCDASGCAGPPP